MRLNNQDLWKREPWEKAGIKLPLFDRMAMIQATKLAPQWVHFGAGNIFRAFPAALAQSLLEQGLMQTGIVVGEGYDEEIIDTCFTPFDNLSIFVTFKSDGTMDKQIISSIASTHRMSSDIDALRDIFVNPSLQMVSFTITEKGYNLANRDGVLLPDIAEDMRQSPKKAASFAGRIAALCHERYSRGSAPLALVSMDNCSHNGDKLRVVIETFAQAWATNGNADKGFLDYVQNPCKLSFPWTMIDKITPWPDDSVHDMLGASGIEQMQGLITKKSTYIAPFVNAEETEYLVIEDSFPNGRPALEKAGVMFTNKETVDKVEKMKVCTCLNPLHTALGVFGCLLGYTRISEEMKNPDLVKLIEGIGYTEGLPVVVDPGIIDPRGFIDQVLRVRLPNPFMPDTPQRIATDTSQKISVRFGETIRAYLSGKAGLQLSVNSLTLIPLVLAAWIRYLLGIDDEGKAFTVDPDPLYEGLASLLAKISLGQKGPFHAALEPILSNSAIFGLNLYEAGLGSRVESYFEELVAGPGAVAATLRKYTGTQA
jgi:fructuronate reductase